MTWASMSRALSQRASQKPSRPASKATAMRLIRCPAFAASSRHRCSNFSNALSSTASFFNGWRSTPGTMPATSQLDRLSSITAISVPSGSRGLGDRLRAFNLQLGHELSPAQLDGVVARLGQGGERERLEDWHVGSPLLLCLAGAACAAVLLMLWLGAQP